MKKRVLFVTYGGGHVPMVTAVSAALRQLAPDIEQTALGLPTARDRLAAAGLDVIGFEDVLDHERDADAIAWGETLAKEHHSPHTGIPRERSVAYLGLSFKDLVQDLGEEAAWRKVGEMGRHAFHPRHTVRRIVERVHPDVIVATNSPRAEAAAIEVGNTLGLATIAMTDVFLAMKYHRNRAQDITYLNRFAQRQLAGAGIVDPSVSRSHFTGNPAFDALFDRPAAPDRTWQRETFEGGGDRPMVLFADMSTWVVAKTNESHRQTPEEIEAQLSLVADAAERAGCDLCIRPHPSQDPTPHESLVAARRGCFMAAKPALHDLLRSVDAVIARSSTVALETVLLRQQLVQLEPWRHPDMPLAQMGVARGAPRLDDLHKVIGQAVSDTAGSERIVRQIEKEFPAKKAADEIARLIVERAEAQPPFSG